MSSAAVGSIGKGTDGNAVRKRRRRGRLYSPNATGRRVKMREEERNIDRRRPVKGILIVLARDKEEPKGRLSSRREKERENAVKQE